MKTIDVRILDERLRGQLPGYATPGSAGLDDTSRRGAGGFGSTGKG